MNIAITVWENRISPVFDAARLLLIADVEDGRVTRRKLVPCQHEKNNEFFEILTGAGVRELICGAISQEHAGKLETCNIGVTAFIGGLVEGVLDCYVCGRSMDGYRMPGCCPGSCCREAAPSHGLVADESVIERKSE